MASISKCAPAKIGYLPFVDAVTRKIKIETNQIKHIQISSHRIPPKKKHMNQQIWLTANNNSFSIHFAWWCCDRFLVLCVSNCRGPKMKPQKRVRLTTIGKSSIIYQFFELPEFGFCVSNEVTTRADSDSGWYFCFFFFLVKVFNDHVDVSDLYVWCLRFAFRLA